MPKFLIVLAGLFLIVLPQQAQSADRLDSFLRRNLELTEWKTAFVDLNNDRTPEILVYATGMSNCGSGGCYFYILSQNARSYRVVSERMLTHLPIRVLPTSTNGWRDLGVMMDGGGIPRPFQVRMRYNGRTYPDNMEVRQRTGGGRIVIQW